jgi:two-component system chemotaxis response regulator CheB
VREAAGGEDLMAGDAWVAAGDHHLGVEHAGAGLRTVRLPGPPVHHQRPSVDVLFHSVARIQGVARVGVLLTGMGSDGADGLLAMRESGAETIAEDEESCVVFGMPREAITRGAAVHVAPLDAIPHLVYELLFRLASRAAGHRRTVPAGGA